MGRPAAPTDPESVVEVPGPWRHRYVAANGARFHVVEAVDGHNAHAPLVLLLHGFPEFWWSWRAQLPLLASHGYRAVAMDLRGYGGSDMPPRGYDQRTLSGDVAGVVKALGERSAVLVGHGWGGSAAWATAVLHPREVSGICVVSAPHPRRLTAQLGSRQGATALSHLMSAQLPFLPERRMSRPTSSYVRDRLRAWSAPGSGFPDADTARRYQNAMSLWPASHCALEYHRWLFRSRVRADGRAFNELMRKPVRVPVCVIQGADDPMIPEREASRSRRRVSGRFESHVIDGVGHFPHEEAPESFDALLLPWLRTLADTGPAQWPAQ